MNDKHMETPSDPGPPPAAAPPYEVTLWHTRTRGRGLRGHTVGYNTVTGSHGVSAPIVTISEDRRLLTDELGIVLELPEPAPAERVVKGGRWYPEARFYDEDPDGDHLQDLVKDPTTLGTRIGTARRKVAIPLTESEVDDLARLRLILDADQAQQAAHAKKVRAQLKEDADSIKTEIALLVKQCAEGVREETLEVERWVDEAASVIRYYDPESKRVVHVETARNQDLREASKRRQGELFPDDEDDDCEDGESPVEEVTAGTHVELVKVPLKKRIQVTAAVRRLCDLDMNDAKELVNRCAEGGERVVLEVAAGRSVAAALEELRNAGADVREPPDDDCDDAADDDLDGHLVVVGIVRSADLDGLGEALDGALAPGQDLGLLGGTELVGEATDEEPLVLRFKREAPDDVLLRADVNLGELRQQLEQLGAVFQR